MQQGNFINLFLARHVSGGRLQPATRIPPQPATPKLQHTSKQERTTNVAIQQKKSQAPDDGCINVRNMLSIEEVN